MLLMEEILLSPVEVGSLSHDLQGFVHFAGFLPFTMRESCLHFFFRSLHFFDPKSFSPSGTERARATAVPTGLGGGGLPVVDVVGRRFFMVFTTP